MKLVVKLHALLLQAVAWLVGLGLRGIGKWLLVILALLGEEVRRYLGLALSGTIIVLLGKASFAVAPAGRPKQIVAVAALLFLAIWAAALKRAIRITRHNSLMRVRNKQAIRDLHENVKDIRGRVNDGLAKRAKGTPLEGAWSSNRSAREEERAAAERAAEQAEADRAAAAERDRRDRASRAERDRELEMLAAEHNPFE